MITSCDLQPTVGQQLCTSQVGAMGKLSYTWSMDGDEYHYRGGDVSEDTWQQQCIHELEANLVR